MPNWCHNTLIVRGPNKELRKFKESASAEVEGEEECLSLQALYPMPEDKERQLEEGKGCYLYSLPHREIQKTREEELRDAWYYWRIHHWGTKWDIGSYLFEAEGLLNFTFDSAWSPPIKAFDKVAADYPELEFELRYYEMGSCFAGLCEWQKGLMTKDEQGEPEDFWFSREVYKSMLGEGEGCLN